MLSVRPHPLPGVFLPEGQKSSRALPFPNLHDLPGRPRACPEGTGQYSTGAGRVVKDRFPYHILKYRVSPDRNNYGCFTLVSATKKFTVQNNIQFPKKMAINRWDWRSYWYWEPVWKIQRYCIQPVRSRNCYRLPVCMPRMSGNLNTGHR